MSNIVKLGRSAGNKSGLAGSGSGATAAGTAGTPTAGQKIAFNSGFAHPSSWHGFGGGEVVQFNTVNFSPGQFNTWGNGAESVHGGFDTGNFLFYAPIKGIYFFTFGIYTARNDADNGFEFGRNGANILSINGGQIFHGQNVSSTADMFAKHTCQVALNCHDTIGVYSYQANSDAHANNNYFGGFLMSE